MCGTKNSRESSFCLLCMYMKKKKGGGGGGRKAPCHKCAGRIRDNTLVIRA